MKTKFGITGLAILLAFIVGSCGGNGQGGAEEAATEALSTGNPAIDGLSTEITRNPNDPALYAERARLFYENNGYDEAIRDLNKALSLDSTNVECLHLLADVYLDYFQSRRALKTMERAAGLYPERIPTLLKLSEFQMILKQYDASMKTIGRVLEIDPQNAEAYFMFGMNFKEQGDTVRAINSFQKAVEYDSELVDGWINLGQLYASIGDPLARRYFDNAIRVAPENIYALHAKADYLSDMGELPEAIEMYRRISRVDPQYDEAYFNSGLIYLDMDSIEQARKQFDIAIETSPTHIMAYYYRGLTQEMLGNREAAMADYEQALRMAPNYEKAQEGLERLKQDG
ncbi:MAG: tetratricopeptide repeat protein [Lewinellaceae bacterium]|nr:tetratricopeptide repeat protein [Lewinellaceae bacterium]MCB9286066.1 tetratricopeptide repeat protein [Lewinellaceae bacterium]